MFFFANFFCFFSSLKTRDIFLPCIQFLLNYHQHNFNAFFKKTIVKYLFQWKTIKKKKFSKIIQIIFCKTKYFISMHLLLNSRFSRKFSVTVDMVWLWYERKKTSFFFSFILKLQNIIISNNCEFSNKYTIQM